MKRLMLVLAFAPLFAVACASDDDEGGDGCSGSVLSCSWSELSAKQEMEACDLITASLDEPAGTKYECKMGEHAGESLTIENAQTCVSHSYPANCPVTVQLTLDCFKAARADACAAFATTGACGKLLVEAAKCQ
jgi:hypothetical protein